MVEIKVECQTSNVQGRMLKVEGRMSNRSFKFPTFDFELYDFGLYDLMTLDFGLYDFGLYDFGLWTFDFQKIELKNRILNKKN